MLSFFLPVLQFFESIPGYFASLNPATLLNQLPGGIAQGFIWAIMALGVYITFRMLDVPDLTVDGTLATGGAVCIVLVTNGWNYELALLISLLAGLIAGLVTGLLHTKLGIPAILAGILTQISLYSINLAAIMGKPTITANTRKYQFYFTLNEVYLTRTILLTAAVCVIIVLILYWYLNTANGSAMRATGINPEMARAQGINTNLMKVVGLSLSNGLVGLCGGILTQYQGSADINQGRGAIVIGLAAVIIGEVLAESIFRKHLTMLLRLVFVVLGSVIYYLVYVFVVWLKLPTDYMKLLTALVVAIFLAVPYLRGQRKSSFAQVRRRNRKEARKNA